MPETDYILAERYYDAVEWCKSAGLSPGSKQVKIICGTTSMEPVRLEPNDRWKDLGMPPKMWEAWRGVLERSGRLW